MLCGRVRGVPPPELPPAERSPAVSPRRAADTARPPGVREEDPLRSLPPLPPYEPEPEGERLGSRERDPRVAWCLRIARSPSRSLLRLAPNGLGPSRAPSLLPPAAPPSCSRLPPGLDAVGGPHAFLILELAWELQSDSCESVSSERSISLLISESSSCCLGLG